MPTTSPTPRWRRRSDARPQELLDAALETFVERGYAATNMDEIARRAGVSKGTLYLYYSGKAELLKAVVRQSLLGNLSEAQTLACAHSGTFGELLNFFLGEFTRRISRTNVSGIPKLILAESGNFPEIAQFYFEEVIHWERLSSEDKDKAIERIHAVLRQAVSEYVTVVNPELLNAQLTKHQVPLPEIDSPEARVLSLLQVGAALMLDLNAYGLKATERAKNKNALEIKIEIIQRRVELAQPGYVRWKKSQS